MAKQVSGGEQNWLRSILGPLTQPGAALRPALDGRSLVIAIRRGDVSLAGRTVSQREVDKLLARGFVRREAPPSRRLVVTFKGEQVIASLRKANSMDDGIETITDVGTGDIRIMNAKESPLLWLARRKDAEGRPLIDAWQLAAGERLRSDFTLAGLTPRMTVDWTRYGAGMSSGIGHPGQASDVMMAARQRLHAALDALGPELADLALDLCCFLKGIGDVERARGFKQRTAKHRLIMALDQLILHYGLSATGPERGKGLVMWAEP